MRNDIKCIEEFERSKKELSDYTKMYNGMKKSPECCGCPSFPYALCIPCGVYNGMVVLEPWLKYRNEE